MTTIVWDHPEQHRYEVYSEDRLAEFSEYAVGSGEIASTHTEIGADFSGRGLARERVASALADSRRRDWRSSRSAPTFAG